MTTPLLDLIVDPVDRLPLERSGEELIARNGERYPLIRGIPVLLRGDVAPTQWIAKRSYEVSRQTSEDPLFIDTLAEMNPRARMALNAELGSNAVFDPVIRHLLGPACGRAYRGGTWRAPPIPSLPLVGSGRLLDIGCNWGRWTIAAARVGFTAIGLDPSLGAVLAAKRLCERMGIKADFVCADARFLPFPAATFDAAFSYSVLQHFSEPDLVATIDELARVLVPAGQSVIQMASSAGIRALASQVRRRFRSPRAFEVRYWSRTKLRRVFSQIGSTTIEPDCFFGLGLQSGDAAGMTHIGRIAIRVSEAVKALRLLHPFADSVYCRSARNSSLRTAEVRIERKQPTPAG